jgi:hypothetical protein
MRPIKIIEDIFKDFIEPKLWREIHITKFKKNYNLTICGSFSGLYLEKLEKYFNVLELNSSEERTITLTLRRKINNV